jgi:transcriptional regulator
VSGIIEETKSNDPIKKREMIHYEKLSEGVYALSYKTQQFISKYTKEQINTYIDSNNVDKLREVSNYFFMASGQYRGLIHYLSNILTFDYLIIPKVKKNKDILTSDKFERDYQYIMDYTDNSYIEETERFITFITLLDGVFYGYESQRDNIVSTQQLPPQYCRSNYKVNGAYGVEFNLRFFEIYKDTELKMKLFEMFPSEFLQYYLDYKSGKTKEWIQLDPDFARCHKFTVLPKPLLSDVFLDLIDLKEYKELDKSQSKLNLYKLVTQNIPINKDTGEPLFELPEVQELHANAQKMITQSGIDVITSPLEIKAVNLQEKGSTIRDNIERATNNVYESANTSKILFSSGTDGGSIGLSHSVKIDESSIFPLLSQYKRWRDNKFKNLFKSKSYQFEIMFPKITIFNRKEMFDLYKEGATLGYSKLMPLAAMGIKQSTFMNLVNFENNFLKLDELLKPLQSSHTQGNGDAKGRPKSEEEALSDKGRKTRETDANANRAK